MKILFINKDDNRGGAAQMAWNLALELRKLGHEVRFIVRRKFSNDDNVYELMENKIVRKLKKIIKRDLTVVFSNLRDQILANDIDTGIDNEILKHPWMDWADVVHCHNLHGNYFKLSNLVKISKKKPVLWTLHDLWSITGHCAYPFECTRYKIGCGKCPRLGDYQKLAWDNSKYLVRSKRKIFDQTKVQLVVPSQWMNDVVKDSILKDKNIEVISNGIDNNIYKKIDNKRSIREELCLPTDKKIVLFFTYGYKNINKGWNHAEKVINSFKGRNDILFIGVGFDGKSEMENLKYVKPIYNAELLVKYYNSADLLLFPSLSESFGMVPLEAAGCGTPTVAFSVGVIPELINHKINGYIAKYDDTKDLIKGINFILNKTNKESKSLSAFCVNIIHEKFTLKKMALFYSKKYEKFKK